MYVHQSMLAVVMVVAMSPVQAGSRYRGNTAPTLSGKPATTVMAGWPYSFTPVATDRERDRLRFYIKNKPAWATFSSSTGKLSGTPAAAQVAMYSNIQISVSDGRVSTFLPAFAVTVTSSPTSTPTNHDPVISGMPASSVEAGSVYSFQPSASDADGDMLTFSVASKPAWATFSVSKGTLTGTPGPTQVGSYGGIVITVSDGLASRVLPAFAITVTAPAGVTQPPPSGTADLSWTAPTQNTDGSLLTNLGGYRIYHGTSSGALNDVRQVAVNVTSYQFTSLATGTHYFAISAFNTDGAESILSTVGSKAIP